MSGLRIPVVGRRYGVLCPVCSNENVFNYHSTAVYGTRCYVCQTMIDLRNPAVPLSSDDTGVLSDGSTGGVCFSPEVEETGGHSATAQVSVVLAGVAEKHRSELPTVMSTEARQAWSARNLQAMSEQFAFLYPLTHAIEYIVFGTRPVARIGNVRIFRKRLPFCRAVNIPVPETSVSYAAPLLAGIIFYLLFTYNVTLMDETWLWRMHHFVTLFFILYLVFLFWTVYTDPGFVRPAYLDNNNDSREDTLTLKDIAAKQRESQWEAVNGQQVERKWCSTCEFYRPVRTAHCYLCGLCVMEYDHHCSVIGACVGRRNVRLFFGFLIACTAATLLIAFSMLAGLCFHGAAFNAWQLALGVVLVALTLFLGIQTALLKISLIYSLGINQTTRERVHNMYGDQPSPFSRGVLRNILWQLCHRGYASLFDDEFVQLCALRMEKRDDHTAGKKALV